MTTVHFPTSSDIYIEAEGKKIAVVQSYRALASRSSRTVEAFGESEPVATLAAQKSYRIELSRLYATDAAIRDGISFYELEDFSLVIVKPDRRVVYSGCCWSNIEESCAVGDMVAEKVTLAAKSRMEVEA